MATHAPPRACCTECDYCRWPPKSSADHSYPFQPISLSPTEGVDFEMCQYTANQIATAFVHYIPNYMDWPIKQNALERWRELIPTLAPIPGVLKDLCSIEWVDQPTEGRMKTLRGWCYRQWKMRGSPVQIRIVKSSPYSGIDLRDIVCTIMHEMCHALFHFACSCPICRCKLNEMEGVGLTEHGPGWQRVRKAVEETATEHLRELLGGDYTSRYMLSYSSEPDTALEDKVRTKMLGGLYERIRREEDKVEREKTGLRSLKYLAWEDNTPEADAQEKLEDEALSSMKCMFERTEEEIE